MHFSYKEKALLSPRIEVKDTELFPELSPPRHNITGTRSARVQLCDVCAELAVSLAGVISKLRVYCEQHYDKMCFSINSDL